MKRCSLAVFFSFVLSITPLFWTNHAIGKDVPNRLSLAISGGASMGAYEAGLIWGVVTLLRQTAPADDLMPDGKPRAIEFASIAGTSAGGINSLIAALIWSVNAEADGGFTNRIDDNIFRDVWLVPDVNRLLPSEPNSPRYLPDDALLSRKDLVEVAGELQKKWCRPGTFRKGVRLPLGVTVTRVRPESMHVSGIEIKNQRFFIPFEMQVQEDGSARFQFRPSDFPLLTDPAMILLPWSGKEESFHISDDRIIDALLTTSAFPIGFGRKRLRYCRQENRVGLTTAMKATVDEADDGHQEILLCPEGYELAQAEFADGGLFDNLPIGLARKLAEAGRNRKKSDLPIKYLYLDPDHGRKTYQTGKEEKINSDISSIEEPGPMAFNLSSEMVVLGGAIGTARKYELYRELTNDSWQLNLSQISRKIATLMDLYHVDTLCDDLLPFFEEQVGCSDRLRHAGRFLELAYGYLQVPIRAPLSAKALKQEEVASSCNFLTSPDSDDDRSATCRVNTLKLRKKMADALGDISEVVAPDDQKLRNRIAESSLSIDSDRSLRVTSRGGPITGGLLGAFGAFLDYKFREFDYYVGVYDAIVVATENQCASRFPSPDDSAQIMACRDRMGERFYDMVGLDDDPKGKYLFALMAKREFGDQKGLQFAYDPMPPEDRDFCIIFEGLDKSILAKGEGQSRSEALISIEREFFEYLKSQGFQPTPDAGGGPSLLSFIMEDPEYWSHELVSRATSRLVYLEKEAEAIYRAEESKTEGEKTANTTLMGAGALALRTATYKYSKFNFSPSTAPEKWFWRNLIPYEAAFDFAEGDLLFLWQPTWNHKNTNLGLRFGFGFTGGVFNTTSDERRENYGLLGIDLTRAGANAFFTGWGVTPSVFHDWKSPEIGHQTTFGCDLHATFLKNRIRIGIGARDLLNAADDTLFITVGLADLPGLVYWLSR